MSLLESRQEQSTNKARTFVVKFVLVHSPVVGPATWQWAAGELRSAGHDVMVPDLVSAARTGDPYAFVGAAVAAAGSADGTVLVGHSGAGVVLPLVEIGMARPPRLVVFVDADVPPCEGVVHPGGEFLDVLRGLATDGLLPPWFEWWDSAVVDQLVPDQERRAPIEAELPLVLLAFMEAAVELPAGWCRGPHAYLRLSEAYQRHAEQAAARGWPVVERRGGHLDIVTEDRSIAETLVDLASRA